MLWNWELSTLENINNSLLVFVFMFCVLGIATLVDHIYEKFRKTKNTKEEKQERENSRFIAVIVLMIMAIVLAVMLIVRNNLQAEAVSKAEEEENFNSKLQYESLISKEDCHLCGDNIGRIHSYYFGEKNIAIIDLNSFNFHVIEINRYDSDRNLMDKDASYSVLTTSSLQSGERLFFDVVGSRGFADGQVTLGEESILSLDKLKSFLCSDCLTELMNQYTYDEEHWNIAILNLEEKTVKVLDKSKIRFQSGDFTIWSRYDGEKREVNLIVLYCPI